MNLITKNILLDGTDVEQKREEILEYFLKTYELFEKGFEVFKNEKVFYKQAILIRQPMIFYFGHTSIFYINKLILGKFIDTRVNESFEKIFAIGVDEMSWDDLNQDNYDWPTVKELKNYRQKVKDIVIKYIKNVKFTLPITWESAMWPVLMGCEHERIHIETSSVLHRQLDIKDIKKDSFFKESKAYKTKEVKNKMIDVKGREITLGVLHDDNPYYGWDNEYGIQEAFDRDFKASKYLVSNGEFLEFVKDGGYENDEYWDSEGNAWKNDTKATHPTFWIKDKKNYKYRTITNIVKLPLSYPVDVNHLEASAFCKWKSKKEQATFVLPSEAMWYMIKEDAKINEKTKANINLEQYSSSSPVNKFKHGKFYDVIGNVWQWTSTRFDKYEGFKIHHLYEDFSTPTFDNKHYVIKGGSFISTGNETTHFSRYAFRRHFFQHAGFRYVQL